MIAEYVVFAVGVLVAFLFHWLILGRRSAL
jgi:hypothetical protein